MPKGEDRLRTEDGKLNLIGPRVKERRREIGVDANALCARLDVDTNGRWRPKRDDLYKLEAQVRIVSDLEMLALATVLEVDVIWLLFGEHRIEKVSQGRNGPLL